MQEKNKIRVLIVDDSAFIRSALKSIINSSGNLEVVGEAKDGKEAVELAMDLAPDVITMDVEMPVMNGIEATKEINKYAKIPIIMLSTLTSTGAEATLDALTYGAVDFITKKSSSGEFKQLKDEIIDKITNIFSSSNIKKVVHRNMLLKQNIEVNKKDRKEALNEKLNLNSDNSYTIGNKNFDNRISDNRNTQLNRTFETKSKDNLQSKSELNKTELSKADLEKSKADIQARIQHRQNNPENPRAGLVSLSYEREDITTSKEYLKPNLSNVKAIFIGISTGGPAALQKLVPELTSKINVPIFIVQHMPPNFTKSLAMRLDGVCKLKVKEAEHNEIIQPSTIYIGKGGSQMLVNSKGQILLDERKYGENLFSPSVEITLDSLMGIYGGKILAIMMTGMGNDGRDSFKKLKMKGGFNIVQDFQSCVVAGMPKSVVDAGAANDVVTLEDIPSYINSLFD